MGAKVKAFLWKNKGYIVHVAAMGVVFLDPSVRATIASHPDYAGVAALAWGFVLHWATGK